MKGAYDLPCHPQLVNLSAFEMKKEKKQKSFILRMDEDMMAAVEKWAADEFRSTNGQLQWIIAEALRKHGRTPKKRRPAEDGGKEDGQ